MYFKFDSDNAKRMTFFSREVEINGQKVNHTDKAVFSSLSEGIKVGEENGQSVYENDYWNTVFCGKAYQKALFLKDKDRVNILEMNIRNPYNKERKKSYPQITVMDFELVE